MINSNMRLYDYYLLDENNAYGQQTIKKDENGNPIIQGSVKLSITNTNTSIQDNINYKNASYLALTHDKNINDTYIIQYGEELLKVLYVTPTRYKQVFLGAYGK